MPTPIKRGTDEPLLQFWESSWTQSQGGRSVQEWKGINISKMSAKAANYAGAGWDGTLRFEHDIATLQLNISSSQIPGVGQVTNEITDRWEVAVDQERPELYTNETFLSIIRANDNNSAATTGNNLQSLQIIAAIKDALQGNGTPEAAWGAFYTRMGQPWKAADGTTDVTGTTLTSGINLIGAFPNLKNFFTDLAVGRTNFVHGKYSLRHTTIAPANYHQNVADFNVEKIYTIAQLLSEAQSGSLWVLPLPGYLAYKISNYPVPEWMLPNYMFGALKLRSSASLAARGKVEISTEYLIDAVAIHTYGLAS